MSDLRFRCTSCSREMAVEPTLAGQQVRCPHCSEVVTAPKESVAATVVENVVVTEDNRLQKWAIAILAPYAIVMTVFAAAFYNRSRDQIHPLSMIPDLDGEYRNATQRMSKTVSELRTRIPPETPLPNSLVTQLGRPIVLGDLEITPLKIEQGPITGYRLAKGMTKPESRTTKGDGLVLTLRLRNRSEDVSFHPTDPYFDRQPRDARDRPYTMVEVGSRRFYGGALPYVFESDTLIREWLQGQENDNQPLLPGQARETTVSTSPKEPVITAVNESPETIWRVQLRRGLTRYLDQDYAVTGVIGVRFSPAEITKPVKTESDS